MEKLVSPTDDTLTLELINNALAVVNLVRIDSVRIDNHDATIGVVRGVSPDSAHPGYEVVMAMGEELLRPEWNIMEIREYWSDDETLPEF